MSPLVTLYHGTSSKRRRAISKGGLRKWSYFTTRKSEAKQYASSGWREGAYDPEEPPGDVWRVRLPAVELKQSAWRFSGVVKTKRGWRAAKTHYKFYKKPPRPELVVIGGRPPRRRKR